MFIINRIVFVFNTLAILALLASYIAPYISPDLIWPVAFAGLTFPALILINVLFIIYWLIFFNMKFLFSLAAIVIGWGHVTKFIQLNAKKTTEKSENAISVVSFNARYFGVMDGIKSEDEDLFKDKLTRISPDVVCMQEMFVMHDVETSALHQYFKSYFKDYYKANVKVKDNRWHCDNMAILSKFPIINKGVVEHHPESYNYTIFADIVAFGDTFRIINTHLQSIKFEKREYEAVKKISIDNEKQDVEAYKNIVTKMKMAFLMRAKQTDSIADFISQSPYKIIVCGDFNDTPLSYAYKNIKGEMKDAFTEAGSGLGRTYVGSMPSFRIDYIMGDESFVFANYYAKAFDFSDHKMVSCEIRLK